MQWRIQILPKPQAKFNNKRIIKSSGMFLFQLEDFMWHDLSCLVLDNVIYLYKVTLLSHLLSFKYHFLNQKPTWPPYYLQNDQTSKSYGLKNTAQMNYEWIFRLKNKKMRNRSSPSLQLTGKRVKHQFTIGAEEVGHGGALDTGRTWRGASRAEREGPARQTIGAAKLSLAIWRERLRPLIAGGRGAAAGR